MGQYEVLQLLKEKGETLTVRDVKDELGISRTSAYDNLSSLEKFGLVECSTRVLIVGNHQRKEVKVYEATA